VGDDTDDPGDARVADGGVRGLERAAEDPGARGPGLVGGGLSPRAAALAGMLPGLPDARSEANLADPNEDCIRVSVSCSEPFSCSVEESEEAGVCSGAPF
jgi:hypothetical protein